MQPVITPYFQYGFNRLRNENKVLDQISSSKLEKFKNLQQSISMCIMQQSSHFFHTEISNIFLCVRIHTPPICKIYTEKTF